MNFIQSTIYVSDKRIEEQLKSLLYDFKKEKKKASKTGADVECASFLPLIFALVSAKYRK